MCVRLCVYLCLSRALLQVYTRKQANKISLKPLGKDERTKNVTDVICAV